VCDGRPPPGRASPCTCRSWRTRESRLQGAAAIDGDGQPELRGWTVFHLPSNPDGKSNAVHPLGLSCPFVCTCAPLIACEVARPCRLPRARGRLPLRLTRRPAEQEGRAEEVGGETRARLRDHSAGVGHRQSSTATCSCAARPRVPASRHTADQPVITCLAASASTGAHGLGARGPAAVDVHADERRRGLMGRMGLHSDAGSEPHRRRSMPMGAAYVCIRLAGVGQEKAIRRRGLHLLLRSCDSSAWKPGRRGQRWWRRAARAQVVVFV
jgi:hypothetical protein